ncbi:hypothetical protein BOTBODRAFT_50206 [Botryobasidium botryosum FD-172 SS1]|uniref:Uncharacterized protein n=1 Tax=Botryobasidium botryosum (strain FD-172 SS1) TaxID=930990 RepID=A0A067NCT2_BOTB1|nr:hypothetical protein BOTBODRAFT_50206 [Botryobasidium botryosum FD-172 SS1]
MPLVTRTARTMVMGLVREHGPISTEGLYKLVPAVPIPEKFVPTPLPQFRKPSNKVPPRPDHPLRSKKYFKYVLADLLQTSHLKRIHKREFVQQDPSQAQGKGKKASGTMQDEWLWKIKDRKKMVKAHEAAAKAAEPVVYSATAIRSGKLPRGVKPVDPKWNPNHAHLSKRRRLSKMAKVEKRAEFWRVLTAAMKEGEAEGREQGMALAHEVVKEKRAQEEKKQAKARVEAEAAARASAKAAKKEKPVAWISDLGFRLGRLWKNPGPPPSSSLSP